MNPAIAIATPFVEHWEGLRLTAYQDQGGVWTIGYGATGDGIHKGLVWTEAQADTRLAADLTAALDEVNDLVTISLADHEAAALVSFVFNLGPHALEESTLLRELNAGNRANVTTDFCMWDKVTIRGIKVPVPGILNRRKSEATLFLTGAMPND